MIYEMIIEDIQSSISLTRTIEIEDNSSFEQFHQVILAVFQEESPKKYVFQITRSIGKKRSNLTIRQQPSGEHVEEDPFNYNDASESMSLFEDSAYERDVLLNHYFKQSGDTAQFVSNEEESSYYTITLKKTAAPAPRVAYPICTAAKGSLDQKNSKRKKRISEKALLVEINQTLDFALERGVFYVGLKKQLDILRVLLIKPSITTPAGPKPKRIFAFKITLEDVGVPVWRKVQVHSNSTFLELHKIIQIVFDWQDEHLHDFMIQKSNGIRQKSVIIEPAEDDAASFADLFFQDGKTRLSEDKERLHDHFVVEKDQARYTYDFGDNWQNKIVLEKILDPAEGVFYPICTGAKNDAPYEDSRHEVLRGELSLLNSNAKAIVADVNEELERRMHHKRMPHKRK